MRSALLAVLLIVLGAHAAAAIDVVVVNSRDWRDVTLGTALAIHEDAQIVWFTNLGDAQIKTQTIKPNSTILVFESSRPVVKNYGSVLRVNGFSDYTVIEHDSYRELQRDHFTGSYEALVLLDPTFGTEAVAFMPMVGHAPMRPFFLDSDTLADVERAAKSTQRTIIAGRFPLRLIEGIESDERYTDLSTTNADRITRTVAQWSPSEWGVIVRIDRVDFGALLKDGPVVVYSGSLPDTIRTVRDIDVSRYEIISADSANLGSQIRAGAGRDISLMLKYGRTITNLPGMTGQILDLETMIVDYPSPDLIVESAVHYTDANALLVTYRNRGTIDTLSFTNIEYGDQSLTDSHVHSVPPQGSIEVPYALDFEETHDLAFINARYGMTLPLANVLLSEQGTPLVRQPVTTSTSANLTVSITGARYDDQAGRLFIDVESATSGFARVEVPLDDETTFTNGPAVGIDGRYTFIIETPYHRSDTFDEPINVVLYYGESAPVYEQRATLQVSFVANRLSGSAVAVASGALVLILIALIAGLVVFITRRRR